MSALQIQNFNQFLDILNLCETGVFSYEDVFKSATINAEDLDEYVLWKPDGYCRIPILKKEPFEVLLMCWEPGQISQIHDHNGQQGWIYVVSGEITEELFSTKKGQKPKMTASRTLGAKMSSHISDAIGSHRLSNQSQERCMSVHLYAKPIDSVHTYREDDGVISTITLQHK